MRLGFRLRFDTLKNMIKPSDTQTSAAKFRKDRLLAIDSFQIFTIILIVGLIIAQFWLMFR